MEYGLLKPMTTKDVLDLHNLKSTFNFALFVKMDSTQGKRAKYCSISSDLVCKISSLDNAIILYEIYFKS